VRACELRSGTLFDYLPENHSLWKPGQHGGGGRAQMPAFLERLRVRLGPESVYGLCLVPEHRPEATWRAQTPQTEQRNVLQPPWESGRRPLWLLRAPRALRERDGVPRHAGHPLTLRSGPERLETGWWDGSDIRRDYYVAMAAGGACLWVFRERQAPCRWFLHGAFG
jgi:protein ImuB